MLLLVVASILLNLGDPLEIILTFGEPFPTITAVLYITLFNYYMITHDKYLTDIILINYYNSQGEKEKRTNVD